tara:strand:- start:445 stop:624 length:180 start_codon:yes stop_codon:yes gene_type:complete
MMSCWKIFCSVRDKDSKTNKLPRIEYKEMIEFKKTMKKALETEKKALDDDMEDLEEIEI